MPTTRRTWIPACAGMTAGAWLSKRGWRSVGDLFTHAVIKASAILLLAACQNLLRNGGYARVRQVVAGDRRTGSRALVVFVLRLAVKRVVVFGK